MKLSKYAFISFVVTAILFIIPFFWLKPGQMDLGGDGNRLYFYDPISYLKLNVFYNVIPSGIGGDAVSYYPLPFISLLAILRFVMSTTFLISVFNGIKLGLGFLFTYMVVKELLNTKPFRYKYKKSLIEISSILAALFYALSPVLVNSGWNEAILSHMQIFLNPFFFFLVLKFFVSNSKKYLVSLLLFSFVFSMAFSYVAAPPFFAFYPLSIIFIALYTKYIRKITISIKTLIFGGVIFFLLQAFHIVPTLIDILSFGSSVSASVFSNAAKFTRGLDYFTAIAPSIKISVSLLALPQRLETGLASYLNIIFISAILLGFYFNKSKALLLTGIFFLVSFFFETANITDTGFLFYKSLFYIPGFKMFRNFYGQWYFTYIFFYTLLLGQCLVIVLGKIKKRYAILLSLGIVITLIIGSRNLLRGAIVNSFQYQSNKIKSVFKIDPEYEKVLRFVHNIPIDGKILTLPLTGEGYQVISGANGEGAYVGPSTFSYLAGKNDYTGYQGLEPFGDFFVNAAYDKNYALFKKLFSKLNIKYVFYNSDKKIYDKSFPGFPYDYSRQFLPQTQEGYKDIIKQLPLDFNKKIDIGKNFHFYPTDTNDYLPHIYTTNNLVYVNDPLNSQFDPWFNNFPPRSIFLDATDAKNTDKNIVLEGENDDFITILHDNSHLHQHRPFISISVDSLQYPFVLLREKFDLWLHRHNHDDYLNFSLFYLSKRISELEGQGSTMSIGSTSWREPRIWEFYNWYRYNSWSLEILRYKVAMENLIDLVNIQAVSENIRNVDKIKINEQLNQHKLRLIRIIAGSNKSTEEINLLFSMVNKTFNSLYVKLNLDYYDQSRLVYAVKQDYHSGEYQVYVENKDSVLNDLTKTYIQMGDKIIKPLDLEGQDLVHFENINIPSNLETKFILSSPSNNLIKDSMWETVGSVNGFDNVVDLGINNVIIDGSGGMVKEIPEWTASKQYVITFEYRTFGDDLVFRVFDNKLQKKGDPKLEGDVYLEKNLNSKIWEKTQSIVTASPQSLKGFLQIVPNSGNKNLHIQIRNLSVVGINYPKVIFKKVTSMSDNQEMTLPKITFTKINLIKYRINVSNAKSEYALVFLEAYDRNWKLYSNVDNKSVLASVKRDIGNLEKLITSIFLTDNKTNKIVQSYFDGYINEGQHGQIFLEPATFEAWGKRTVGQEKHFVANGYANVWIVTPKDTGSKTSYTLILEKSTQRYFYIFLALSLVTALSLLIYLLILIVKKDEKTN